MAQLHLYLPEDVASEVRRLASARQQSVSAYLSDLVRAQIADDWPDGFFEHVVGGWAGSPLERAAAPEHDDREALDVPARHKRVHSDTK